MKNLVVGIYAHPEAYPPTLNALNELSDCFAEIGVVGRPSLKSSWKYPPNVTIFVKGKQVSDLQQQQASLPLKIFYFIRYTWLFFKMIKRYKPQVILAYDSIALYSYHLLRPFITYPHHSWYHNHDVVEAATQRKYSVGWLALRSEKKAFRYLSVFTLPTNDRLPHFDLSGFKGKYFCVPNYPSKKIFLPYSTSGDLSLSVVLIFQGSMDSTHGIEEILPVMQEKVAGKELALKLLGKSLPGYKESIDNLSASYQVSNKVHFEGLRPYKDIPAVSASCHIGMAIYTKQNVMSTTISTASNKIYEYAAVGLPVLCFDNEYYRKHLEGYSWIFFTDCSAASYHSVIRSIVERYQELSGAAREDFMNHLNFEIIFRPVKDYIDAL